MPLQDDMKLISVDDHIIEHPRVWSDRLPPALREAGPRVVEVTEDNAVALGAATATAGAFAAVIKPGQQVWVFEGKAHPQLGLNAVAGRKKDEWGFEPTRYEDMLLGCYDPAARLKDMDADGVHAQLCFPTLPGFAGSRFLRAKDKQLGQACVEAYNDFILDEWCAADPDRYIPMTIVPLWDPELAAAELERCAAAGSRALAFPENTEGIGLPSFHTEFWDPLLAVAEAHEIPLCMHFGTSERVMPISSDAPAPAQFVLMGCNSMSALSDLVFSPTFTKFPSLKVALSEGGVGWLPYITERMDYVWEAHRRWYTAIDSERPPSETVRRNIWGCFIADRFGIESRHAIGIDRIMWEGDYPHSDSAWPESRKRAAEALAEVPDEEVRRIVETNARELFHFDGAGHAPCETASDIDTFVA